MAYQKLNWKNGADPTLSAENLNHMDDGIASASEVADQALEVAGNVSGNWTKIAFTTTMQDNNSEVYFNETLGLVYIRLSLRVFNATSSPVIMSFPNNEFSLRTGYFSVIGINQNASEPVGAYILGKFGKDLVIQEHPSNAGWNITNPYIYATVVLGAVKN